MNRTKKYLLLRHVKIHNANAFSSPLTIGFPAMTAWLGAMHALERKLRQHSWQRVGSSVADGCQGRFVGTPAGFPSRKRTLHCASYGGGTAYCHRICGTLRHNAVGVRVPQMVPAVMPLGVFI